MTPARLQRSASDRRERSVGSTVYVDQPLDGWSGAWTRGGQALIYAHASYAPAGDSFLICNGQNQYQIISCVYRDGAARLRVGRAGAFASGGADVWTSYLALRAGDQPCILAYDRQRGSGALYQLPDAPPGASPRPAGSAPLWSGALGAGWSALVPLDGAAGFMAYDAQSGALLSYALDDLARGPRPLGPPARIAPGWTRLLCCHGADEEAPVLVAYSQSRSARPNTALYPIAPGGVVCHEAASACWIEAGWEQVVPGADPACFLASRWDPIMRGMFQTIYQVRAYDQPPVELTVYAHAWPEDEWDLLAVVPGPRQPAYPHYAGDCGRPPLYYLAYDSRSGELDIIGIIPPPCGPAAPISPPSARGSER